MREALLTRSLLLVASGALFFPCRFVAALAHEVLGHGLTAKVLGGTFHGFRIATGMAAVPSRAWFDVPGETPRDAALLAGSGMAAEVVVAVAALALERLIARQDATRERPRTIRRLALVELAGFCLAEAGAYVAFGDGDPQDLLEALAASHALAVAFAVGGAIAFTVAVFIFFARFLELAQAHVASSRRERFGFIAIAHVLPATGLLLVIPSSEATWVARCLTPLLLIGVAVAAAWRAPPARAVVPLDPVPCAVGLPLVTLVERAVTTFWLQYGVTFRG